MTVFDSRDIRYKSPFGAVSCGTAVSLTLTPEAGAAAAAYIERLVENKNEQFANARDVRNFFERIIERQARRIIGRGGTEIGCITEQDIPAAPDGTPKKPQHKIGFSIEP